jgi:lysophospholipase L1-like esterase
MFLLMTLLTAAPCRSPTPACTCVPGGQPHTVSEARAAIAERDALFSGLVVSTSFRHDSIRVQSTRGDSIWWRSRTVIATIIPEEIWKGKLADTVQVETDAQTTACGASLARGYRYLIDASRQEKSGLYTDKCRWTRPRSLTDSLQVLLRQASPPSIRGGPARLAALASDEDPTRFEPEIQAFEAQDRASPPPSGGIVFVGSSSIKNWTEVSSDFPSLPILNRGFGGSTLADVLYYFDRVVLPYRPRLIVLYAGDNDVAMGRTPDRVVSDFRLFMKQLRSRLPETRIVYLSIKPSPSRRPYLQAAREINKRIRTEIARDRLATYIDVFTPMLGPEGQPRPELFGSDSLHMTRAGYQLWRSLLEPLLH